MLQSVMTSLCPASLIHSQPSTYKYIQTKHTQTMIPAPGVRWLDFFDDLVVAVPPADLQLRPGLRMDGTHITPAYVSLIESALHNTSVEELK